MCPQRPHPHSLNLARSPSFCFALGFLRSLSSHPRALLEVRLVACARKVLGKQYAPARVSGRPLGHNQTTWRDGAQPSLGCVVRAGAPGPTAEDLALPKKNIFIPTDFSLRCEAPEAVAASTSGLSANGSQQGSLEKNGVDVLDLQRVRTQHLCLLCAVSPCTSRFHVHAASLH